MTIEKKVAFVTGGSRGIGRAIVEKFAEEGYVVGFSYINSKEVANELINELKNKNMEVFALKFDVSNYVDCCEKFEYIYEKYGNIDVLVNNAGITKDKLFIRMSEEDFDKVTNTNLKGVFNCIKQVAKKMTKKRSGAIINMSSLAGIVGNVGQANYSATKAGVIGMTKTLAAELGPYGVRVNAIAPGFIKTDMTDKIPENIKDKIISSIPLKIIGYPSDIANLAYFLASDQAKYINGQTISVDGGLSSI
ncbi:3-oxoacyl-[acyl-carrier-protein] reductase [Peptostreptococcus equinus]|uniref:3-oxoacyl-[acyl-carrier-protein] reductase n=1 Tax=Peptostreptococcus equinus TaxID=3003601 RepID=A0ABY7JLQ2_9FIRM|nr:3-oxoacyl-[acyl-carrier-protein] reductase [Peptostreptococcus sp. CBA3647]WAW14291.1 3-oxoacyl-[acyl-carrier-protein] reductase [Peptostreptococcus sp. CBA3647]